jgi:opacity protein-like surface antigen
VKKSKGESMKARVVVYLLAVFGALIPGLRAQETPSKVDIFAGYSYIRTSPSTSSYDSFHLNGGSANVAYNFNGWLSGVADFGGYANGNIGRFATSSTLSTYLFGPRISYHHWSRFTPFGQVLFGAARTNATAFDTAGSQNAFAMTVGGGLDYRFTEHWKIRPAQVEYLLTRFQEGTSGNQTQNNLRVSAGVVFSF